MKNQSIIFKILIGFMLLPLMAFGQNKLDEMKSYFDQRDAYYQENYFSKGVKTYEMSGTGFYPYIRDRNFYELRANSEGYLENSKRLEIHRKSRLNLLNSNRQFQSADWISMEPNLSTWAGRMISLSFDPVNPNIIYAGAAEGGLWKTSDLGNSWECLTNDIPAIGVSAVAVNPQNPNEILIGTGEGKATLLNGTAITYRNGVGVLKSFDAGNTWEETSFEYDFPEGVSTFDIDWDPISSENVYLAATNGFWVSRDSGINWTQKVITTTTDVVINKIDPSILYIVIAGNGVFKSTNSGEDWTLLDNGLPSGASIGFSGLSISDSFPNTIYVTISNPTDGFSLEGLYKTTNGGSSWTNVSLPPSDYTCQPNNQNFCQGWANNEVAVSPTDPNLILAGGVSFWRTADGGNNWTQHSIFFGGEVNISTYADQQAILFSPHDSNIVVDACDGGIMVSTDAGLTWPHKNNTLITSQFYNIASSRLDPEFIIGGLQDHGLYAFDFSSGNTIGSKWAGSDGVNVSIDHSDDSIIYGDYIFGVHLKSISRGISPAGTFFVNNGITESGPAFASTVMDPFDPQVLYYCSLNKVYKTSNGAGIWIPKANIPDGKQLAVDRVDNNYIYLSRWDFSTGVHSFYNSEDAGETWIETISSPGWRVTDIEGDPSETGTIYVTKNGPVANNPHILRSIDYGNSWEDITNNLPDVSTNAIEINPFNNEYLYVATDLGVFSSENGGESWTEYNDGMPVTYSLDLNYHKADSTLRVGTHGRGLWKTKAIPDVIILSTQDEALNSFESLNIFPNPVTDSMNLNIDLKKTSTLGINLYNLNGQKVNSIYKEKLSRGTHKLELLKNSRIEKIASGVYFLKISIDGKSMIRKVIFK